MTKETQEFAKQEKEDRAVFRRVFGNDDGKSVLTWILNELRYYNMDDPKDTDPLLITFCNRLLGKIGIIHPQNLYKDVEVRVDNSNDRDLDEIINSQIEE